MNIRLLDRSQNISCEAIVLEDLPYEDIECALDSGHRRARRLAGTLVIDGDLSDSTQCLWTMMADCLMDASVVDALLAAGCTGFSACSVEVKGGWGRDYRLLRAHGWGGYAPEASGIRLVESCRECGYLRYSPLHNAERLFDRSQWDGSDVFMIWPLPNFIFLSERASSIIERLHPTGLALVSTGDICLAPYGFSPGRLSDWLPATYARNLAAHVDIF